MLKHPRHNRISMCGIVLGFFLYWLGVDKCEKWEIDKITGVFIPKAENTEFKIPEGLFSPAVGFL